jgi:hypothetical protein
VAAVLRLLLLAILILLLVRFLVRLGQLAAAALRAGSTAESPDAAPPPAAVALVPCRRCGTFVPRTLAAAGSGGGFLCRACASAGG